MWLINTTTMKLEEFVSSTVPKYAILSHTWALGHEISFQEMQSSPPMMKSGYRKIQNCCEQALADGLSYAWVDTCCMLRPGPWGISVSFVLQG